MKIGIIGIGVVGSAMYKSLQEKCTENGNVDQVFGYDKYKNIGNFQEMLNTDFVLLSLPTLYSENTKSYDKSSINEVCQQLADADYQGLVVVKSTVEPTTCQTIADTYKLSVVHNPEFLSAKTAYEDFHDQSHIVIGSTSSTNPIHVDSFIEFYQKYYPNAIISNISSTESETVKIFCNNFYAVKIQFFNELYVLCQQIGANYNVVKTTMLKNGWINPMHTDVPGHDGKLSFGGMCFPKDTNALLQFMKSIHTPHQIIEATVNERKMMRDCDNH